MRHKSKIDGFCEIVWNIGVLACIWIGMSRTDMLRDRVKELEGKVAALESPVSFLLPDEGFEIALDPTADITITLDVNGKVIEDSGTVTGTFEDFIDSDGDEINVTEKSQ